MHKFIKTASLFLAASVLLLPLSACSGGGGDGFALAVHKQSDTQRKADPQTEKDLRSEKI